jgi:hypothetical protein
MKLIEFLLEIFGWLQITVGCFLGAALFGGALCQAFPSHERFDAFIVTSSIGMIFGAIWATHIWRKYGTVEWLSSIRRIS